MQSFLRSTLALAFLGALFLLNPASAEESNDFNEVDFYFYGDLDSGDGNISTAAPTSDEDTESDCPQDSNRLSFIGNDRQWGEVGSWIVDLETPGAISTGDYTFTIWANSTQGTVENVQFRISVSVGSGGDDAQATSQSKTLTDSSETATRFDIAFDLTNESFDEEDSEIEILLEYSGGDPAESPIAGGSTEQIVVLTSSVEHPSGIGNFSISHYRAWFDQIEVQDSSERVFVEARVQSAFGLSDIDDNFLELGVFGDVSGNLGLMAEFNSKEADNGTYTASFYWYYNDDNAISDTYHFNLQVKDIQGNTWEIASEEDLYLVIHEYKVDDVITSGNIQINNQTGISKVKAGSSFTIDITVVVEGEPGVTFNPVPVTILWVSDTNEIVLYETAVFANPGTTVTTSFRHTIADEGEYLIKVVLDRDNIVKELDETNNMAEFILLVEDPQKEDLMGSVVDSVKEGGVVTMLAILSVTSLLLGGYFLMKRGGEMEFDWEEDDEF